MTKNLRKISVRLETVTPLWMGGAEFRPELRPPSVRGCLRFWLRALLGGTLGEDLPSLQKAEAAVFGDTSRASQVVVRIDSDVPRLGPAVMSAEQFPGVAYMFWSTYQRKRDAILPGESFDLHLHARPWDFPSVEVQGATLGQDDAFHLSAAALWLLLRLGGAGARVRRGGGILQASAPPTGWPESVPSPVSKATTPVELAAELAEGLQTIRRSLPWQTAAPQAVSSFDILHPNVCQMLVVNQTFPTWWEALDWAGRQFVEFRRSHRSDASAVAELLTRGRIAAATIQRAVLGLPIVFFFKSIFQALTQRGLPASEARRKASATVVPNRRLGRASPLLLRVAPLAGASPQFAVVMTLFRSRFLPDRQMTIRPQDRSIRPVSVDVPTNYALIDNWFDFLRSGGTELSPVAFASESQHA
jgi:CRISPR-associated protein Cmr1